MRRLIVLLVVVIGIALIAACAAPAGTAGPPGEVGPPARLVLKVLPAHLVLRARMVPKGLPGLTIEPPPLWAVPPATNAMKNSMTRHQETGHAWALNRVVDGKAPAYPTTKLKDPPEGYTWDDILYVIGGFNWKARFVDKQGNVITGAEDAKTQYNLENKSLKLG